MIFSSLLFSLNDKYTLYFFINFKNIPKASESTSVVVNYVSCGSWLVIVLDFMLWETHCYTSITQCN